MRVKKHAIDDIERMRRDAVQRIMRDCPIDDEWIFEQQRLAKLADECRAFVRLMADEQGRLSPGLIRETLGAFGWAFISSSRPKEDCKERRADYDRRTNEFVERVEQAVARLLDIEGPDPQKDQPPGS